MKKNFVVMFEYDNGASVNNHVAIIRANDKEEAKKIFNKKIPTIFNQYEDTCTLTSIAEVADNVDLIFVQGGAYWVRQSTIGLNELYFVDIYEEVK